MLIPLSSSILAGVFATYISEGRIMAASIPIEPQATPHTVDFPGILG
jgi:hypothetical protein